MSSNSPHPFARYPFLGLCLFLGGFSLPVHADPTPEDQGAAQPANILFMVMDDVGIDQMRAFGYGGVDAPKTPNLDAIAQAGVRFRNTWTMPSCTPTRATFFNGRYPLRTNVMNAVTPKDLANSQVSPYEYTTPRLLRAKGYVSGLFGKMHLSGSQVNPATNPWGNEVYQILGWDRFEGFLDGAPYSIDTTAGGVSPSLDADGQGVYGCGFVPNRASNPAYGADQGACYLASGVCEELSTATVKTPGRTCLERGGILDPNQPCQTTPPSKLNFDTQNAYYTGDWVINDESGATRTLAPSDPSGRGYRLVQEADRAIAWIKSQPRRQPWMTTLGFSAIHEPVQPPPEDLVPAGSPDTSGYDCAATRQNRELAKQMIEAVDSEIGRVLVETGLAKYAPDGGLDYHPEKTKTMVIVTSDNGTWTTSVKPPFDATRAKGTPYQTGVWVPLMVAGPMVTAPGREVTEMVNGADLFALFGEIAGIDVAKAVPKSHVLDAQSMLPYLTTPGHGPIRTSNYTAQGNNLRSSTAPPTPCLLEIMNACTQTFPSKGVCEDQGGIWYGADGAAGPEGYPSCCEVNEDLIAQGKSPVDIPLTQRAIRNQDYKLVQKLSVNCDGGDPVQVNELYRINQNAPIPRLDRAANNLLDGRELTPPQQRNHQILLRKLRQLDNSVVACEGDGNLDLVVDDTDLMGWWLFSRLNAGLSSWYDFNLDGLTDEADLSIIEQHYGHDCMSAKQASVQ